MKKIAKKYTVVTNSSQYEEMMDHIREFEYHAFDTETTGLNVLTDKVIGYGLSGKEGIGYYLPILYWDKLHQKLLEFPHNLDYIAPLCELEQIICWNGSYDVRITKNDLGIDLTHKLVSEGMLMKHAIQEEGPFGLKATAIELQEHIGLDVEKEANEEQLELKANIKENGGSVTKTNYELYKADMPVIGKYCCADVDLTLRIFHYYYNKLESEGLWDFFYDEEVITLYREVTIPMEGKGVKIDMGFLRRSHKEITKDMEKLHEEVIGELVSTDEFRGYIKQVASEKFPPKKTGSFAQRVVAEYNLDLPKSPSGRFSLTAKNVEQLPESEAKEFLQGNLEAIPNPELISLDLWEQANDGIVNISSKKQMGDFVFDYLKLKPLSKTKSGQGQFNESYVVHLSEKHGLEWANKLRLYNKLQKIRSSYMDRFLENHHQGYYYFSYKQHGTISGRYGSDAQQLPRPMEEGEDHPIVLKYANRIRKFFIAGKGRKFIDCDYESLEPHVFAHVSGDEGLRDIFRKGHDFYSTIAIATENIEGVSADKKADNYLGKVDKPRRQKAKAYSLGVPYGLSPYALAKSLEVSQDEAQELYDGYLNGFPELKKWMEDSKKQAQTKGYVKTQTGRIRHLPKVKELYSKHGDKLLDYKYRMKYQATLKKRGMDKKEAEDLVKSEYMDYKNGINNARNFQIQGLSASIVNRAAIKVNRKFKELGIDGWCCAQIHDQLIFNVPEDKAEECAAIVKEIMETNYKLSIELKAPPEIGDDFFEAH